MNANKERGGQGLAAAIRKAYLRGADDYHMEPLLAVDRRGRPIGKIQDGDTVIFCCRRGEREIELTEMFTQEDFPYVERVRRENLHFVLLTLYHEKFTGMPVAFGPETLEDTLSKTLSAAGKKQFHCAESEKYAHVTFFFNGGDNQPAPGEEDFCVPSPRGVPFDTVPELSLDQVVDKVSSRLEQDDFIVVNFANGDVIGHTPNMEAKVKAAECVSEQLTRLVEEAKKQDYAIMVTADHGNLERMITPKGTPDVAHTCNLVPFILIDPRSAEAVLNPEVGSLRDVAPTVLDMMGLDAPEVMTGKSLIVSRNEKTPRKVLLIILDGWGMGEEDETNPIHIGRTEKWRTILEGNPHTFLHASGEWVGLGKGKPGNSEAGHINIGAGRVVPQDDQRLDKAMADGSFETNPVFVRAIEKTRKEGKALHLLTYLTEMSSHGSVEYAKKLAAMAKELPEVYLHIILDGRSTENGSAPDRVLELEKTLQELGSGEIVDCVGRGLVLDRDHNYDLVKKGYDAMVLGRGETYPFEA